LFLGYKSNNSQS